MERYLVIAEAVVNEAFQTSPASILICNPSSGERACATRTLQSFARKAFRGPVEANDPDLVKYIDMVNVAKTRGDNFETGIKLALQAILISPRFLFRSYKEASASSPRNLDGYELASRLSYFLWSTMPDEALLQAAPQLKDPAVLKAQVLRMIASPKSDGFVDNFMSQWLHLDLMKFSDPDPNFYPAFNETLRADMKKEIRAMLKHMVTEDLSLKELLATRYSFMNQRLASFYGIPGVTGENLRQVNYTSSERSGLLGLGGILTMTSNPNRTSIVKRGFWIMSTFLCNEPNTAPPNIPALPDEIGTATTLRERMQEHTKSSACIGCHIQMDQYGFSLENFNGIGQFRTTENGLAIDNQAILPSGKSFAGLAGLHQNLVDDPQFDKCFSKKLLSYAVGRQMESNDQCVVEKVAGKEQKLSDQKLSDALLRVISSESFLQIRGEGK